MNLTNNTVTGISLESENDRLILLKVDSSNLHFYQSDKTKDFVSYTDTDDALSMSVKNSHSTIKPLIVIQGLKRSIKLTMSENSQCDLLMIDVVDPSFQSSQKMTNDFDCEIILEKNAVLNSVKLFMKNNFSSNVNYHRTVTLKDSSIFYDRQIFVTNYSAKIKSTVNLIGKYAQIYSSGCLLSSAGEFYYEPIQQHFEQYTKSLLDFKVVLAKRAKSFFRGLVVMDKTAQKSEAYQENKNLLLSRTARADSEPRLEIIPNDVRCKHGSATAELDQKQLYYLISRGFDPIQARQMVVKSFLTAALTFTHESEETFLQKFVLNTIDNIFNHNSEIFIS